MSNELGKSNEALNRARRAKREERKRKFLEILADRGDLRAAAQGAGVSLRSVLRWRREDSSFAASLEDAEEVAVLELAAEARKRALEGSDRLLIFLLSSLAGDRFGFGAYRRWTRQAELDTAHPLSPEELAASIRRAAEEIDASIPSSPQTPEDAIL